MTEFNKKTDPTFSTVIETEFTFEMQQRLRFVVFDAEEKNTTLYLTKNWKGKPKIGKLITTVGDILAAGGVLEKNLM